MLIFVIHQKKKNKTQNKFNGFYNNEKYKNKIKLIFNLNQGFFSNKKSAVLSI